MKRIIFVILILIVINFSTNVFAIYYEKLTNIRLLLNIAEPIISVEKNQDTIIKSINPNTPMQEFYFTVKNYKNIDDVKKISEINLEFEIEIVNSDNTFPIKYELYDCLTNEKILLDDNKSSKIDMHKNVEFERCYKLCVIYEKQNSSSTESSIDISVNATPKIYL